MPANNRRPFVVEKLLVLALHVADMSLEVSMTEYDDLHIFQYRSLSQLSKSELDVGQPLGGTTEFATMRAEDILDFPIRHVCVCADDGVQVRNNARFSSSNCMDWSEVEGFYRWKDGAFELKPHTLVEVNHRNGPQANAPREYVVDAVD
jgi:hypothetical protein